DEAVAASVSKTGRAVVVHEAPQTGGFGAELAATIMERCFLSLEAPVIRVTAPDAPYPVGMYEDRYIPNVERALDGNRRRAPFLARGNAPCVAPSQGAHGAPCLGTPAVS